MASSLTMLTGKEFGSPMVGQVPHYQLHQTELFECARNNSVNVAGLVQGFGNMDPRPLSQSALPHSRFS